MIINVHHTGIRLIQGSQLDETLHAVILELIVLSIDQHCKAV